jgi:hypothetical protein
MLGDRWRIKVQGLGAVELTAKGLGFFGLVTGLCRSEPGSTDTESGMNRCACPAPLHTLRGGGWIEVSTELALWVCVQKVGLNVSAELAGLRKLQPRWVQHQFNCGAVCRLVCPVEPPWA